MREIRPVLVDIDRQLEDATRAKQQLEAERWRAEYLYSRAATIYGGSSEIQRNIVARRLLDLGPDR